MYCPRCDKSIPKDKIEEIRRRLATEFDKDDLDKGQCPVCSTAMVPLPVQR